MIRFARYVFALVLALPLACKTPTLEEACAEYCEAAEGAGCDIAGAECNTGCDNLRDALEQTGRGDCIEPYAALMDCAAGMDFECFNGIATPTGSGCTGEAQDLAECFGLIED